MTDYPPSLVVIATYDNGDEEVLRLEVLGGNMALGEIHAEERTGQLYLAVPDDIKKGRKVLSTYTETGL